MSPAHDRPQNWTGSIDTHRIQAERILGAGAKGTVYAATVLYQDGRKGEYALKVNNTPGDDGIFGEDAVRMGGKQIPGAVVPHGPYSVQIAGESEPSMGVIMPRVDGVNVAGKVGAEGPLSKRETVSMMAQVARTLNKAHDEGLVHMDVKPSNILYETKSKRFLTADWGEVHPKQAKLQEDIGTYGYQAPEQWQGAKADPKMDVYALALTSAEAHTGSAHRRLKGWMGPLAVKEFIVAGKEGHPNVDDPHLNAVLKRMTMVKPDERGSMLDTMTDLAAYKEARNVYDAEDMEAVTKNLISRASDPKKRQPILDAAAAAGLLRDAPGEHPRRKALEAISSMAPDISALDQEAIAQQQRQRAQEAARVQEQPTPRTNMPRR